MNIELVTPFLDSTKNVIQTMAFTSCSPGTPYVKKTNVAWGDVTGIIGLAGKDFTGNMVLSFEQSAILSIVSKMLMEEFSSISEEVVDAVGELTNMITGSSKTALAELGYPVQMASPMMITGKGSELKASAANNIIYVIPFQTENGDFVVEANLSKRD